MTKRKKNNGSRRKNGKPTECTVCGVPVASGRALGGHMSKHTRDNKAIRRTRQKKTISGGNRIQTPFCMVDTLPSIAKNSFDGPSLLQSMLPAAQEAKKLREASSNIVIGLRMLADKKRKDAEELDLMAKKAEAIL